MSTPDKVRVAFVGAGQFANLFHYPSLAKLAEREGTVEVVAVADMDEAKRTATAEKYAIPRQYADAAEMLDRESGKIDAVYAIMPPRPLPPVAADVIAAGLHLFCEKPAGVDSSATAALAKAAADAGVLSLVATNRRYSPLWRRAVDIVTENGPPSGAIAEFHKDMDRAMFGMDVLHADVLHVVDPLRDLLGEPADVAAHADHWYGDEGFGENSMNVYNALIRFENGGTGILSANRRAGGRVERFELHGHYVTVVAELPKQLTIYRRGEKQPQVVTAAEVVGEADAGDMLMTYGYYQENKAFVDAVRTGTRPPTDLADNLRTMRLCDRIRGGSHVAKP